MGIELPALRARIRIDRGNAIIGCTGEQRIADLRRRIRIDSTLLQRSLLAGVVGPGELQILHVVTVDLREWRITRARRGTTIRIPIRRSRVCRRPRIRRIRNWRNDAMRHERKREEYDRPQDRQDSEAAHRAPRGLRQLRRQQEQTEARQCQRNQQAWKQSPVERTGLPQGPRNSQHGDQDEQPHPAGLSPPEQDTCDQISQSGQHVVERTPERGEVNTAEQQPQSDQYDQGCKNAVDQSHARAPIFSTVSATCRCDDELPIGGQKEVGVQARDTSSFRVEQRSAPKIVPRLGDALRVALISVLQLDNRHVATDFNRRAKRR